MKKWLTNVLLLFLIVIQVFARTSGAKAETVKNVYIFGSAYCSHCAALKEDLVSFIPEHPEVQVIYLETTDLTEASAKENSELFHQVRTAYNIDQPLTPLIIVGNVYLVGWDEENGLTKLAKMIELADDTDYVAKIRSQQTVHVNAQTITDSITIPFIGSVNPEQLSLPVLAVVLGTLDGFNPCAMWVLLFLIGMLLNMKDKKRMWFLGSLFLVISAFMYFIVMAAWLKLAVDALQMQAIRLVIGVVALICGMIQLHQYQKARQEEAGCEVIDEKRRQRVIRQIRTALGKQSLLLSAVGIALLAVSVNLYELMCSAGLPVVFSQILSMNQVSAWQGIGYLVIYIFFYLIDDLIVFVVAMKTMQLNGFSTKYAKIGHLIGGFLMLLIGLLMIFKPQWLQLNFSLIVSLFVV